MEYRLGLDVGSTSIGWAILKLENGEPVSIEDMGVRIFSDGRDEKTKEPLAVTRRNARGARRNKDRYKARREELLACLKENGLLPVSKEKNQKLINQCPYELRATAVEKEISLHQFGRALFHIDQRRGFKSNRKSDKEDKDSSALKTAIKNTREILDEKGYKTLGCYLNDFKKDGQSTRIHPSEITNEKKKKEKIYNFSPDRAMYENEFETIWTKQAEYHNELTDELKEKIRNDIFYQRELKAQEAGNCTIDNNEKRALKCLPIVQKFRILSQINNLELERFRKSDAYLIDSCSDYRERIYNMLHNKKSMTFTSIRKKLNLPDVKFNLEAREDKLLGDSTSCELAKKERFGLRWYDFTEEQQTEIVTKLHDEPDESKLIDWLRDECNLDETVAEEICKAKLADGYGRISLKVIRKAMPYLEAGYQYHDALLKAGYHHSDLGEGKGQDNELKYYGELLDGKVIGGSFTKDDEKFPEKYYGKINNPTVHIGLNQIRRVVNKLIKKYGKPSQIVVELARDFALGQEERNKITSGQNRNRSNNERIKKKLEEIGETVNGDNITRYKLWEECKEQCVFTGKSIGISQLFTSQVEIEHLLPHSLTYNNSNANKVVCLMRANRDKQNRSPFQAFGTSPAEYVWEDILARSQHLPHNKQWRFKEDAMEQFEGEDENGEKKIIARMLKDTQYMSKVAKEYLSYICPPNNIWSVNGGLTYMLRENWGLNSVLKEVSDSAYREALGDEKVDKIFGNNEENTEKKKVKKDRTTHYHHSVDALVLACTSRSLLQKLSGEMKVSEKKDIDKHNVPKPINGVDVGEFRGTVRHILENMIISHKPDHKNVKLALSRGRTTGRLHRETAYGYVGEAEKEGMITVATRKNLSSFEKESDIAKISDDKIKSDLEDDFYRLKDDKKGWQEFLQKYSDAQGNKVKSVRIHDTKNRDALVEVCDKDGNPYKYYEAQGNFCMEVYCPNKGKNAGKWQSEIIRTYDAHQKDFIPNWRKENPTAKLIMRLMINDMVACYEGEERIIYRVKKMSGGRVALRPHFIAKEETKDNCTEKFSAKQLQEKNARKISVDEIGQIQDRGAIPPVKILDNTTKKEPATA